MHIYHNSRNKKFREPFGALPSESTVKICLLVNEADGETQIFLRLWDGEERLIPMQKDHDGMFVASLEMPKTPGLLWYYFIVEENGKRYFYCKTKNGEGEILDHPNDSSWQITVYDKNFKTPEWFKHSVMYQIFPDRFFKSEKSCEISGRKAEYTLYEDWYSPIFIQKHPFEDGPAYNDFFGGSLRGIIEKIPYLKELGIGVIYLNPIFEAFSNHRYDTGDYGKIDPILGTEEAFKELCEKCEEAGIRIILDGVFSHTGSDSVYFNKYGSYGEDTGAFRDKNSPYRSWYQWCGENGGYNSWWGCSNLPNVNEMEPTYIDYILAGDDAIIKKWIRKGAFGWRLDVADELPDEFIKILRREVKRENPEAVVIGEVWEDASNKESYGVRREYLLGHELDSVMNYPFKDCTLAFLTGSISAEDFSERMGELFEHYPFEALYSAMNILGTHDTVRAKTCLSGQYIDPNLSMEEKGRFRLDAKSETRAIKRLRLGAFLQMTFAGVPCIYYGDEIGMQGLSDPYNRMPYSWRCVDTELLEFYKKITALRNSCDALRTGVFETLYARDGVFVYLRKIENGRDVFGKRAENGKYLCIVNRNENSERIGLELEGAVRLEALLGENNAKCRNGIAEIEINGLRCGIFRCFP
ncbi:MAG: glycoside hydrolase family 13 protein [Clostridia bacterium]|nr:glycoside hydrolase family 13 protein [Clostridia bacterium]